MQHYSVKPLRATLLPSRRLAALLTGMHMLAVLPLVLVPLDAALRLALSLALVVSLICYGYRHVLRKSGEAVDGLHLAADGTFSVRLRQGGWQPAEVRGSSFVQPWLTVLHLSLEGRRFGIALVLLPDMLPCEDFRRLRVWLRWGRKEVNSA